MEHRADADILKDHALKWIGESYAEPRERAGRGRDEGFDPAVAADIAAQGWMGVMVAERLGGIGGGLADMAGIMEAVGRGIVAEPVLSVGGLAAPLLARLGTPRADDLARSVVAGERIAVLVHQEGDSGFERELATSSVSETASGYRLSVDKAPTLDAAGADVLVVSARDDAGRTALFAVDPKAHGVLRKGFRAVDGRTTASLTLSGLEVGLEARLSGEADVGLLIASALEDASFLVCAEAAGAMAVLVDETTAYLKTRRQFGAPLASFQVLQHRMVDMLLALEETRSVIEAALDAQDTPGRGRAITLAKIVTARSAQFVAQQAVQLHGGIGMTDELRISRHFRRLMLCETLFGDADWHAERYARHCQ